MRVLKISTTIALACLALSGCAAISSAPAGPLKVGDASVTLGREWSNISAIAPNRSKKVVLLSIDGPALNRLYVSDALAPGDFLVRPASKQQPTPVVRADMSASERIEFVADSVAAMDYQRVQVVRPRPAKFDGRSAVRFDLTALTSDGLEISGTALVAESDGRTHVMIYLAPAEYYFSAYLPEVEQVFASAGAAG